MHWQPRPGFRRLALNLRLVCRDALETTDTLARRVRLIGLDVQAVQLKQCTRHDDGHSAAACQARDRRGRPELAIVNQRHAGRGRPNRATIRRADLSRRSFRHTRHRCILRQRSRANPGKQNQGCTKAWSRPAQEYNQISISVMLPTVAASQAREAARTRPQAKCTRLQRMVCCSLCPPCGANRRTAAG